MAGSVPWAWREKHVLAPARIDPRGPLVDLDDMDVRRRLEVQHAALLARHGIAHLDSSQLRSKNREVTQAISRTLYEQDCAGILFKSNVDEGLCVALFEGRGHLEEDGAVDALTRDGPELLKVCDQFNLVPRSADLPAYVILGKPGAQTAARAYESLARAFRRLTRR